jgi:hypothetical protein
MGVVVEAAVVLSVVMVVGIPAAAFVGVVVDVDGDDDVVGALVAVEVVPVLLWIFGSFGGS